jgi:hypothetical protein
MLSFFKYATHRVSESEGAKISVKWCFQKEDQWKFQASNAKFQINSKFQIGNSKFEFIPDNVLRVQEHPDTASPHPLRIAIGASPSERMTRFVISPYDLIMRSALLAKTAQVQSPFSVWRRDRDEVR